MNNITNNLLDVQRYIINTEKTHGRIAGSVRLLAVSKAFSAPCIHEAFMAGQRAFGESYVDEAINKVKALTDLDIEWHYIGPIQSNKTRKIAEHFDWVQSVDRKKIADRLNIQRPEEDAPLNVCIQVNISSEASKSGTTPGQLASLAAHITDLPRLRLRGIMGIPAPAQEMETQQQAFRQLTGLYRQLQQEGYQVDTLSMGMTRDMQAAIAEGSTMVRIGTAIFGHRNKAGTQ